MDGWNRWMDRMGWDGDALIQFKIQLKTKDQHRNERNTDWKYI